MHLEIPSTNKWVEDVNVIIFSVNTRRVSLVLLVSLVQGAIIFVGIINVTCLY